jgi:glycosyltransferase involved in cell wall biosynthesis
MTDLVTICIPTYRRPDVLSVCIKSVIDQRYRPLEIIISDDSPEDDSRAIVERFVPPRDVTIRYFHNKPSLGQNANVNRLFDLATGDRLMLLHDDDFLLPNSIGALAECWNAEAAPVIAFGRQQMVSDNGTPIETGTNQLNKTYFRTSEHAGYRRSVLECALLRQIPNNGYLALTEACRRIRYLPASEMPCGCDTDFSLRLGIEYDRAGAVFVDQLTTAYRNSLSSVSTDPKMQSKLRPIDKSRLFDTIESLRLEPSIEYARNIVLTSIASDALIGFSLRGLPRDALRVYLSKYYLRRERLTLRGLYHLLVVMLPRLTKLRRFRPVIRTQSE